CRAGRDSFFMDPEVSIFPCLTLERPMGNLLESTFGEIWNGSAADSARLAVDRCSMPCWMICTARSSMRRRPDRAARWIFSNWLRIFTGRGVTA
ncbi:MAG: SPASM domain-containing protein, partial [Candidatus Krumholzibacteria bacterium]|nr:SPASM domain-containing protein [Candidatus Krumholzibacteria bacterium]